MTLPKDMFSAKNNSPITTLTASINSSDSVMSVEDASVLSSEFPNLAVIGTSDNAEIVKCVSKDGNNINIVRGFNNTSAGVWPAGSTVARNFTAYDHEAFKENIEYLNTQLGTKQDTLTFDAVPTDGSTNPVESNGIAAALDTKQDTLTFDAVPTAASTNPVESNGIAASFSQVNTELSLKAPLANPEFTGTATAPTVSATTTNNNQIATTAFVHKVGCYYGAGTIVAGTATTFYSAAITDRMRLIDVCFVTPGNVASDVTWTTASPSTSTNNKGSITFAGTFTGSTTVRFVLVDPITFGLTTTA